MTNKLILFAPTKKFEHLCFGRTAGNFIIARQYALNSFAEKLHLPNLSENQESYFMASFPYFCFHPEQDKALDELLITLQSNSHREDLETIRLKALEIKDEAYQTILNHTSISEGEKQFLEALGRLQVDYKEEKGADINIRYLARQKDARNTIQIWNTAFECLFETKPLDIQSDYLINFGLGKIPANMSSSDWHEILLCNLKERSDISSPGDGLFISDDETRVDYAYKGGYAVYHMPRDSFDGEGLMEDIKKFIYYDKSIYGSGVGMGMGACGNFKYISPSI